MNISEKFNLNYRIIAQDIYGNLHTLTSIVENTKRNNQFIDRLNSLAVRINIEKTNTLSAQKCKIQIYNLNKTSRKLLKKSKLDTNIYRSIEVYGGYRDYLVLLFKGNIQSAQSYRQNENFITDIDVSCDFGIINGNTNISFASSYSKNDIVRNIINNIPYVKPGYINYNNINMCISPRGRVFSGKTWDLLAELKTNNTDVFIDNEQLNIIDNNEAFTADVLYITSDSGLLQEPREYDGYLEVKLLFEPLANLNNFIVLDSISKPEYNGNYKIIGITHNLDIEKIGKQSEGTTTLKLQFTTNELKLVNSR